MNNEIIIHKEYNELGDGMLAIIREMEECSPEELRLWIIQELSTTDSECWWLINIGVKILEDKMTQSCSGGKQ